MTQGVVVQYAAVPERRPVIPKFAPHQKQMMSQIVFGGEHDLAQGVGTYGAYPE